MNQERPAEVGTGLIRWLAVQTEAAELNRTHPDWRYGQSLFNALQMMDPPLAEKVRGTDADPFYRDDQNRVSAFAQAVMTRVTPTDEGLSDCEGWVCQSCGADNFIPTGWIRVAPPAESGAES